MPVNIPPLSSPKCILPPLKMKDPEMGFIMKMLREADRDKDGCYNKDELKNALKHLGAYFPSWRANRCLIHADADNDGQISGDEIGALVEYLLSRGFGK